MISKLLYTHVGCFDYFVFIVDVLITMHTCMMF